MEISFFVKDVLPNDPYCKMCNYTKLTLYDKDELIFKCKTCGSLFKYNKPQKKSRLVVDPDLDNTKDNVMLFIDPKKSKTDESNDGYEFVKSTNIRNNPEDN